MNDMKAKIIFIAASIFMILASLTPNVISVSAQGDNSESGLRPAYYKADIKQSTWDEDKIVFNSIKDSVIGDEFDFVGARECILQDDGNWGEATETTSWNSIEIGVEDGKTYTIRLYVHNNNPYGDVNDPYNNKGVAMNTKVAFSIPGTPSTKIRVRGILTSDNASPSYYHDYVDFSGDRTFHLEYVKGSALWENNQVGLGGVSLSDNIVEAKDGGVLVGYDALDGRIPGCYDFDGTASIQVKVVYDTEFAVINKVRIVGDADKSWKKSVDAKIGDQVEFQAQYKNYSSERHPDVVMRNILPESLEYVPGSTKLYNFNYQDGASVQIDDVINPNKGINIGNYGGYIDITKNDGANAFVRITATVKGDNLAYGRNMLVDWAQGQAGAKEQKVLQDYATVYVYKIDWPKILMLILSVAILLCLAVIMWLLHKLKRIIRQ